jgi:hypothetical protein
VRDSRIAMIYEGTNEIQAIDLVMRKLLDDPRRIDALLAEFDTEVATQTTLVTPADTTPEAGAAATEAKAWATTLAHQATLIRESLAALRAARGTDPEAPLRVADDILHGLGHAMLAWGWARLSRAAGKALSARATTSASGGETAGSAPAEASTEGYGDNFLHQQVELAAYGRNWLLPAAAWRWQRVTQGAPALPWVRA